MGWFQFPPGQGGGIGGGGGTGTTATVFPTVPNGKVQLKDGDGKVVQAVPLDTRGKGTYTKTLTEADIGQKKLTAHYTGDATFAAKSQDEFVTAVSDADGLGATVAQLPSVEQIVAGPGIWISAPNGQGIVTISAEPLLTEAGTEDLYDICWSTEVGTAPWGAVGQFTAVGVNGTNLRSRDGKNWVQMRSGTDTAIYGVSAELNPDLPNGHLEYVGVGPNGTGFYGLLGSPDGDGMVTTGQLRDQAGLIVDTLISTAIIYTADTTVPNNQFEGGLAQGGINNGGNATQGAPVVTTETAEVITYFNITKCELNKGLGSGLGKPSLIFSASAQEVIKIKTYMNVTDLRFTPGTSIAGQFPYYENIPDPAGGTLSNGRHGTISVPYFLYNDQATVPGTPVPIYWVVPYIKATVDGTVAVQGNLSGTVGIGWEASDFYNASIFLTLGTAGVNLGIGHHTIQVDYWLGINRATDPAAVSGNSLPWFSFTSHFVVGP